MLEDPRYADRRMCMQCMVAAMGTVGAASGLRSWIAARFRGRLGPAGLRAATVTLFALAVVGSGLIFSGTGA
jgi:hypothetical protein